MKRSRGRSTVSAEIIVTAAHTVVIALCTRLLTRARHDGPVWNAKVEELAAEPAAAAVQRGGQSYRQFSTVASNALQEEEEE